LAAAILASFRRVPPITHDEAAELLKIAGAPSSIDAEYVARFLTFVAKWYRTWESGNDLLLMEAPKRSRRQRIRNAAAELRRLLLEEIEVSAGDDAIIYRRLLDALQQDLPPPIAATDVDRGALLSVLDNFYRQIAPNAGRSKDGPAVRFFAAVIQRIEGRVVTSSAIEMMLRRQWGRRATVRLD
jgi:hypothetical protein